MHTATIPATVFSPDAGRPLRRVSFVEDDADIRLVAEMALADEEGLEVQLCASGAEAIAQVPRFAPDLIVLDVRMPQMSGPETLARLRQVPALAQTRAVFLTASSEAFTLRLLATPGIVAVIHKPFDPMTLCDKLHTIWRSAQRGAGEDS